MRTTNREFAIIIYKCSKLFFFLLLLAVNYRIICDKSVLSYVYMCILFLYCKIFSFYKDNDRFSNVVISRNLITSNLLIFLEGYTHTHSHILTNLRIKISYSFL